MKHVALNQIWWLMIAQKIWIKLRVSSLASVRLTILLVVGYVTLRVVIFSYPLIWFFFFYFGVKLININRFISLNELIRFMGNAIKFVRLIMNDLELLFSYKISNVYINWNIKINNYLKYYNLLHITYINLINNLTLYRYQFE